MLHSAAYGEGQATAMTKLAMGARQYKTMMGAVERMARRLGGNAPEAFQALRRGGPVPAHLEADVNRIKGMLAGSGTGHSWKQLAAGIGDEAALRNQSFRLIPRGHVENQRVLTTLPGERGRPASFSEYVRYAQNRPMSGTGWGPDGYVTREALSARKAAPVPPMYDPAERAIRSGNADVARGEFLRLNPGSRYTRRPEKDLATVLHMPKGGMFLPSGAARGGIPLSNQIDPSNELAHVGAGRGAYLYRGGGVTTGPNDHVFLSGNAAVAKHYSSGMNGFQAQRQGVQMGNTGPLAGVPQARPDTNLPAPRLLQWFPNTVARTPQGQQLPTRRHGEGITGTAGMSYSQIKGLNGTASGGGIDGLTSYQVDFPTRNLGPREQRTPRGMRSLLGEDQVQKFGLRPYANATGWAYDTPQGTYVMRGRQAFEKDFHTIDGRRAGLAAGRPPPRNQPLPLPIYNGGPP